MSDRCPFPLSAQNPSRYGVTAKIWECLRRNSQFSEDLALLSTGRSQSAARERMRQNATAQRLWEALGRRLEHLIRLPWAEVGKNAKASIVAALERREDLVCIPPPPDVTSLDSKHSRVEVERWLAHVVEFWTRARVVALPIFHVDVSHERGTLESVARIVGAPLSAASRDGSGKEFGTPYEWETKLFLEQLPNSLSKADALRQAAWKFYGHGDREQFPNPLSPAGMRRAGRYHRSAGGHVRAKHESLQRWIFHAYWERH